MTTEGLRLRREAAGLSQRHLAEQAGVARQTLNAIECGKQSPSVDLALTLARCLDCRVEDLFALAPEPPIQAELVPGVRETSGRRLVLGLVHDRWVAHPLRADDHRPADAFLNERIGNRVSVLPAGPTERFQHSLLVAGCAPLLATLAHLPSRTGRNPAIRWIPASSAGALEMLAQGTVHVAGIHYVDEAGSPANEVAVAKQFPRQSMTAVTLVSWRQGLIVPRGNPLGLGSGDLARPGLRIASREEGSGAQKLLVRELEASDLAPEQTNFGAPLSGHLEVAQAVRLGVAEVGVGIEAAALAYGLDFLPLTEERFDLVTSIEHRRSEAFQKLVDELESDAFRLEANALGGYDVSEAGRAVPLT